MNEITEFLGDARMFLPVLLKGLGMTVILTPAALLASMALGFIWNMMGNSRLLALRVVGRTIINVVRGIPIIVQLFYVYFVLPDLGINLSAFAAGVLGLGLAYSVYQAENFRAGFEAIDPALIEAGQSLGMTRATLLRRVTLPLGIRIALPAFGNTAVMLLKDSSIASTITVAELTRAGQLLAYSTSKNATVYTLIALLYLLTSLPLAGGVRALEQRFSRR